MEMASLLYLERHSLQKSAWSSASHDLLAPSSMMFPEPYVLNWAIGSVHRGWAPSVSSSLHVDQLLLSTISSLLQKEEIPFNLFLMTERMTSLLIKAFFCLLSAC